MGVRLNTTGYITSIGEKEAFGDNNIKLRVSFKTEREQYSSKYDLNSKKSTSTETKYDTLSCVAYGKIAEYICANYNRLKNETKNSDIRVELYGYLEVDVVDLPGCKLKFVSKMPGKKEEYNITIPEIDDDLFHRSTFTRLTIREITFIDIERVKQTSINGSRERTLKRGSSLNNSDSANDETAKISNEKVLISDEDIKSVYDEVAE